MSAPIDHVSVREFARLDGCDEKLVRRAIKGGKLPVSADGKLDPALAGSGWRRQNRRKTESADIAEVSAEPAKDEQHLIDELKKLGWQSGDGLSDEDFIAEILAGRFRTTFAAERVKENALAAKHLLAARREAGDVVDIEIAEAVLFEQARQFRDAWLNWPVRVGPLIAAELGVAADPVVEALKAHVQQQLDDLGEPDSDFRGDEG